jgi:DNA-binding response OmpR family regulator
MMNGMNQQATAAVSPLRDGVDSLAIDANHAFLADASKHILVINDTQEILDLFRDILEEEGYRVSLYSYAFQDISEVRHIRPDLVILDFIIGGEAHGWQMLQKMKMTRDTMNIPVIVCTAALSLARELDGHLRAKNVSVVLKPFDIDDLIEAVSSTLREGGPLSPAAPSGHARSSVPSAS